MAREFERKFLVTGLGAIVGRAGARIVQGPIADDPMTVRVRNIEAEALTTLNGRAAGIVRDEYEFPVPMHHACELPPPARRRARPQASSFHLRTA